MVTVPWIPLQDVVGKVVDMAEGLKSKHLIGDVLAELFNLFPDTLEECITEPSSNYHNSVD